jgi:archaellum component FlaC
MIKEVQIYAETDKAKRMIEEIKARDNNFNFSSAFFDFLQAQLGRGGAKDDLTYAKEKLFKIRSDIRQMEKEVEFWSNKIITLEMLEKERAKQIKEDEIRKCEAGKEAMVNFTSIAKDKGYSEEVIKDLWIKYKNCGGGILSFFTTNAPEVKDGK